MLLASSPRQGSQTLVRVGGLVGHSAWWPSAMLRQRVPNCKARAPLIGRAEQITIGHRLLDAFIFDLMDTW